jgi:hypothetical protein
MFDNGVSQQISMQGSRVLILSGRFEGTEGVCLGQDRTGKWAISPNYSDEILLLVPEEDFGLLIDLSAEPGRS